MLRYSNSNFKLISQIFITNVALNLFGFPRLKSHIIITKHKQTKWKLKHFVHFSALFRKKRWIKNGFNKNEWRHEERLELRSSNNALCQLLNWAFSLKSTLKPTHFCACWTYSSEYCIHYWRFSSKEIEIT